MTQLAGITMALHAHLNLLCLQEIRSNPDMWHGVPACFHSYSSFHVETFTKWLQVSKLQRKHISEQRLRNRLTL